MLEIPYNKNYILNLEKKKGNAGDYEPCVICGKGIKDGTSKYRVNVWDGNILLTEKELLSKTEEEKNSSSLGTYPIGNECIKLYPQLKDYLIKQ